MSICLVASSLFQRHVAFHFRLDGSGFELFQICVPLDAVGLGAGEQTVKDHYTVRVTLTRFVYMPLIILLSQDCGLDSCTLFLQVRVYTSLKKHVENILHLYKEKHVEKIEK